MQLSSLVLLTAQTRGAAMLVILNAPKNVFRDPES